MATHDERKGPGGDGGAASRDIISRAREQESVTESDGFNPLLDDDDEGEGTRKEVSLELPDMPLPGFGSLKDVHRNRPTELPSPFGRPARAAEDDPSSVVYPEGEATMEPVEADEPHDDEPFSSGGGNDLDALLKEFSFVDEEESTPYKNALEEEIEGVEEDSVADPRAASFRSSWGDPEGEYSVDSTMAQFMENEDEEDEDPLAGFDIDAVLGLGIEAGASDVHISADAEVSFTILGEIVRASDLGHAYGEVSGDVTQRLQQAIISHVLEASFITDLELDTSYVLRTGPHAGRRTRLSVGRSFSKIFMVFRVIADQIPTPDELGVEATIQQWCYLPNGLVLICGPTGTGKSTTFASMIRKIQLERAQKIITIEKPVEFVYGNDGKALITQREVGKDAREFSSALTSAMRQAPDIIMIGEVRNQLEVDEVLRASETGHLALTTLHASSPPGAINRIKSLYAGEEQRRILASLKDNCRGIANQVLVKTVDGKSRFAIRSVLNVTPEVSLMIGDGDVEGINEYMRAQGTTMEHGLVRAVHERKCTIEAARAQSPYPAYFDELMEE